MDGASWQRKARGCSGWNSLPSPGFSSSSPNHCNSRSNWAMMIKTFGWLPGSSTTSDHNLIIASAVWARWSFFSLRLCPEPVSDARSLDFSLSLFNLFLRGCQLISLSTLMFWLVWNLYLTNVIDLIDPNRTTETRPEPHEKELNRFQSEIWNSTDPKL